MQGKTRKTRKSNRPVRGTSLPVPSQHAASAPSRATSHPAAVTTTAQSTSDRLADHYRYVFADLRRIAIIAGVILAVLIALSFVLD